jgi:hypothetical protein
MNELKVFEETNDTSDPYQSIRDVLVLGLYSMIEQLDWAGTAHAIELWKTRARQAYRGDALFHAKVNAVMANVVHHAQRLNK